MMSKCKLKQHSAATSHLRGCEGIKKTIFREKQELPWEAILNIEADRLATEARDETSANDTTFKRFPASKMMLYINNLPITRSTMNEVRYAWSTQERIRANMTKRFKCDPTAADSIDWYSHRSTIMA
eukprot:scaffold72964_cov58-Attheya_sp.AAC.1